MLRIAHLSDLHFGRTRPELLAPLTAAVNALEPGLVVISGDLTQRARREQFAEAARLAGALSGPKLVVPGNHDVPLWNVLRRLARPFARYRAAFGEEKEPSFRSGGVSVIGVNSVDPLAWQRGKLTVGHIARTAARISAEKGLRVVVLHHPLVHPPGSTKDPMEGAEAAALAFAQAGADLVLSGHLHNWSAEPFTVLGRAMLCIQAGTGLSTRVRGEPNDFNLIEAQPGRVLVTRHAALEDGSAFVALPTEEFRDGPQGWQRVGGAAAEPLRAGAA